MGPDPEPAPRRSVHFDSRVAGQASSSGRHTRNHSMASVKHRKSTDSDAAFLTTFRTVSIELGEEGSRVPPKNEMGSGAAAPKKAAANEFQDIEWHTMDLDNLYRSLSTSDTYGLTGTWVKRKLAEDGPNIPASPPSQAFRKFMNYCFGGFGTILFVCAVMVFIAWQPLGGKNPDPAYLALAIALTTVFLLQAFFNALQDWSSSRVMASITNVLPANCVVLRDGIRTEIDANEIVQGDVLYVKSGNKVPADIRLIKVSSDCKFDRSILTGECEPINGTVESTDANYLETKCIGLQGTHCVAGTATGVCVATGDRTVFGRIAKLSSNPKTEMTPIQKDIYKFTVIISAVMVTMVLVVIIAWAAWLRKEHHGWLPPPALIVACVTIAVAFIPEGLPIAMTSTLTITANMMKANNVLCKSLATVETLGAVSVICSDKTGTLTKNQMFVTECSSGTTIVSAQEATEMYQRKNDFNYHKVNSTMNQLRSLSCLCNAAEFDGTDKNPNLMERNIFGDATDQACLRFSEGFGPTAEIRDQWRILFEIAFNSSNKFMVRLLQIDNTQGIDNVLPPTEANMFHSTDILLTIKGAPDVLLPRCTQYINEDGEPSEIDTAALLNIESLKNTWSAQGKRVILIARKVLQQRDFTADLHSADFEREVLDQASTGLVLVGLVGIVDPPRDEIPEVIRTLRGAGIRVFMVTGDFKLTAQAIAAECGIITTPMAGVSDVEALRPESMFNADTPGSDTDSLVDWKKPKPATPKSIVISGPEMAGLDDDQWDILCDCQEVVFARTTPEQKLRIVKELQKRDIIVAMTGDGVNDAPSLKAANVGIALACGSDVAIAAADMVLLDSFAAIVEAVKLGRLVYDNLKKTIAYLLPAGSYSEFWPVITHVLFGLPQILSSFLMIVICCLTDCINAITLAYEKPEANVLTRPPRDVKKDRLVNGKLLLHAYCWVGTFECVTSFALSYWHLTRKGVPFALLFMKFGYMPPTYPYSPEYVKQAVREASSIYFVNLIIIQMFNLLSTRTRHLSIIQQAPLFRKATKNVAIFPAMAFGFVVIAIFCYVPGIEKAVHSTPIPLMNWFIPIGFGMFLLLVDECRKWGVRRWPEGPLAKLAW